MAIKAGLVGLPNVGKSTLFNALTKAGIPAENYPFCTIDTHVAITEVPDKKLNKLGTIFKSQKIVPATVQFADIAGLVKGASEGEGLGNQFLSYIMEVDLILHVLRCFQDDNVTHVYNEINPISDFEAIKTELMLKDLESIEKRENKLNEIINKSKIKNLSIIQVKDLKKEKDLIEQIKSLLERGDMQQIQKLVKEKKEEKITTIPILSSKNFLIIANLSENDFSGQNYTGNSFYQILIKKFGPDKVIPVSAKIEAELSQLGDEEQTEMIECLNIKQRGLNQIIKSSYKNLNLITFYTCGPTESHAWSIKKGTNIHTAAGEIHSDIQRGFICAEVYNYDDILIYENEQKVKDAGKIRIEGKDYIVKDGDIIHVRFNV